MTLVDNLTRKGRGMLYAGALTGVALTGTNCAQVIHDISQDLEIPESTVLEVIGAGMAESGDSTLEKYAGIARTMAEQERQEELAEKGRPSTNVNVNVNQPQTNTEKQSSKSSVREPSSDVEYSNTRENKKSGVETYSKIRGFSHTAFIDKDGNGRASVARTSLDARVWKFDTSEFQDFQRAVLPRDYTMHVVMYSEDGSLHDFTVDVYDPKGDLIITTPGNLKYEGKLLPYFSHTFNTDDLREISGPGVYTVVVKADGEAKDSFRRELTDAPNQIPR